MKHRRGFTLVELMVTAVMLTMLAAAGYAVFAAGTRAAGKARRYGRMVAHAERAMNGMAADIREAVAHGDVRLTALDAQYDGLDADTIDFIAPRMRQAQLEPDVTERCEVGYYIDNDPDTEARWLLRREDGTLDDDPLEGGALMPAGPRVSELNLEFYDGLDWEVEWLDKKEFPLAVRIGIVVVDAEDLEAPRYFETTLSIPAR